MAGAPPLVPPAIGDQGPGKYILVQYDIPGETTWHCRLLLAHLHAGEWVILTPDGDIYSEEYTQDNSDITGWRHYDPSIGPPYGIAAGDIYDFLPRPAAGIMQQLLQEGLVHASHERIRRGLPAPGGHAMGGGAPVAPVAGGVVPALAGGGAGGGGAAVPAVAPAAQPAAPAAAGPADALAGLGGLPDAVMGVGANNHGGGGVADSPGEDARTLGISRDGDGARFKEFHSAVQECKAVDFQDWPINGPRTVKHVITQMLNHGGSALGHHQSWRVACKLQPTDGPSMEHESWSRVLDAMMSYDQLDVTNLASAELVVRAIQRIEEKHKHKISSSEDAGEGSLFMGAAGGSRSGLVISPKLTEWIGTEMQKEAMVAKERRKAREERALSRKADKKDESGKRVGDFGGHVFHGHGSQL